MENKTTSAESKVEDQQPLAKRARISINQSDSSSTSTNQSDSFSISTNQSESFSISTNQSDSSSTPTNDVPPTSPLEMIIKSPGHLHIAEDIFKNLDQENLTAKCEKVNEDWRNILKNPWFLFKACIHKGLLKSKYIPEWTKVIQALTEQNLSKHLNEHLIRIHSVKVCINPGLDIQL